MPTILVVDDEEPVRQLLASIFRDQGYRAVPARNGRHALEVLANDRPDLILSDVMMPLLTGADLCRQIKANPATRGIPVILMSAAGRAVTDGAGADGYLEKPFALHEVETLVARWLEATARSPIHEGDSG